MVYRDRTLPTPHATPSSLIPIDKIQRNIGHYICSPDWQQQSSPTAFGTPLRGFFAGKWLQGSGGLKSWFPSRQITPLQVIVSFCGRQIASHGYRSESVLPLNTYCAYRLRINMKYYPYVNSMSRLFHEGILEERI